MFDLGELPDGWITGRLSDPSVAIINPKKSEVCAFSDDTTVTFVPMAAVDENAGAITRTEVRPLGAVRKGYTYFREDDVLFAKITPCMENGKCAIGRGLESGIGFASTEFHVVRATNHTSPEWIHVLLRSQQLRDEAKNNMHGAAGQQRVPVDFLQSLEIPVPPLPEQRRIVGRIEALTRRLEEARQTRQAALAETGQAYASALASAFTSLDDTPTRRLGEIAGIIGGNSIPENAPAPESPTDRVGLMKVSDMNTEGNESAVIRCRLETSAAEAKRRKLRVLPIGAVVFPKRGGAIATNKKRTLAIPAALDPNMMGVFPLPDSGLESSFLRWWFESIDLASLQEDGGIPQVNKKHIDPLEIPVPTPAVQRRVVARLDALRAKLDELQRLQREVEADLAAFTPALLAKAFRGEL